jgi:arsenite-transporting ATPase
MAGAVLCSKLPEINAVETHSAKRYVIVPRLKNEPVGADRLLELAAEN